VPIHGSNVTSVHDEEFSHFVVDTEPRLRRALVAAYGSERGREATAEALAYAWEHWDALHAIGNRIGYLYRVGQSRTRPRRSRPLFTRSPDPEPWFEPNLVAALEGLTESQRTAVVLVHGFGWTMREVAECTGVRVTSVQNHLERGLRKLRAHLKVRNDARTG
jgi:DNA-directed RNA polymerase specialized sigma24 family protein